MTWVYKSGRHVSAPTVEKLDQMQEYRARSDSADATIAPGVKFPSINTKVDIYEFHSNVYKEPLLGTVEQHSVTLSGELQE